MRLSARLQFVFTLSLLKPHIQLRDTRQMKASYPQVRRSAATYKLHGNDIPEPYDYLEDPSNPETKEFVAKQNELFQKYMQSSTSLSDKISESITRTQNYARTGCPSVRNGLLYFFHNTGLQNQSVLMRAAGEHASPEVFLDPNTLSADGTSAIKSTGWSEDERLFAYSISEKGSDWQHIRIRDAQSKADLPEVIQWAKFTGIAWWQNHGFFYTRYPALKDDVERGVETDSAENAFICFHKVGTAQEADVEILKVPDHPKWSLAAEVSDCHRYLIVSLFDGCEPNNLVWVAKLPDEVGALAQPLTFNKVVNDFYGEYAYLGNDAEKFYFTSSHEAPRKKVVEICLSDTAEKVLVAERDSVLNYAGLAQDTLLLVYLEDVKDVLYLRKLHDETPTKLELPIGTIVSCFVSRKRSFASLKVSSFLLPGRSFIMDINDPKGSLRVFRDDAVAGFCADDFETKQVFYNSTDGTRIPMFLVFKKGSASADSPVLLYGYGGFNISLTPYFSASRIVFVQHLGGVLAVPNIRGGGEYGQAWHDAGRRENKQHCFTDFIAAAKYLHANQIGSPSTTAIMGGSNGGLLVAAVANQAPDVFRCVVCQVGVLDMYKFHKFTIGHAWTSDYGNPDDEMDFAVLQKYSPLHNIKPNVHYPAILVVTGDHDDRVVPLHSLKYVATLQHENPSNGGPFLARIEVAVGHGAGKPTSKIIREQSDVYAFIAVNTGAKWQ